MSRWWKAVASTIEKSSGPASVVVVLQKISEARAHVSESKVSVEQLLSIVCSTSGQRSCVHIPVVTAALCRLITAYFRAKPSEVSKFLVAVQSWLSSSSGLSVSSVRSGSDKQRECGVAVMCALIGENPPLASYLNECCAILQKCASKKSALSLRLAAANSLLDLARRGGGGALRNTRHCRAELVKVMDTLARDRSAAVMTATVDVLLHSAHHLSLSEMLSFVRKNINSKYAHVSFEYGSVLGRLLARQIPHTSSQPSAVGSSDVLSVGGSPLKSAAISTGAILTKISKYSTRAILDDLSEEKALLSSIVDFKSAFTVAWAFYLQMFPTLSSSASSSSTLASTSSATTKKSDMVSIGSVEMLAAFLRECVALSRVDSAQLSFVIETVANSMLQASVKDSCAASSSGGRLLHRDECMALSHAWYILRALLWKLDEWCALKAAKCVCALLQQSATSNATRLNYLCLNALCFLLWRLQGASRAIVDESGLVCAKLCAHWSAACRSRAADCWSVMATHNSEHAFMWASPLLKNIAASLVMQGSADRLNPGLFELDGNALALARMVEAIPKLAYGVPNKLLTEAFTVALDLFNNADSENVEVSCRLQVCGWLLLDALIRLGTGWAHDKAKTLFNLWRETIPTDFHFAPATESQALALISARYAAYSALLSFVRIFQAQIPEKRELEKLVCNRLSCALLFDTKVSSMLKDKKNEVVAASNSVVREMSRLRSVMHCIYFHLPVKAFREKWVSLLKMCNAQFSHKKTAPCLHMARLLDTGRVDVLSASGRLVSVDSLRTRFDAWTAAPLRAEELVNVEWLPHDIRHPVAFGLQSLQKPSEEGSFYEGRVKPRLTGDYLASFDCDASVRLFCRLFPFQTEGHKQQLVSHFANVAKTAKGAEKSDELTTVLHNSAAVVLGCCHSMAEMNLSFGKCKCRSLVLGVAFDLLHFRSPLVRRASAQIFGVLATLEDSGFRKHLIQTLADNTKFKNHKRHVTAGRIVALSFVCKRLAMAESNEFVSATLAAIQKLHSLDDGSSHKHASAKNLDARPLWTLVALHQIVEVCHARFAAKWMLASELHTVHCSVLQMAFAFCCAPQKRTLKMSESTLEVLCELLHAICSFALRKTAVRREDSDSSLRILNVALPICQWLQTVSWQSVRAAALKCAVVLRREMAVTPPLVLETQHCLFSSEESHQLAGVRFVQRLLDENVSLLFDGGLFDCLLYLVDSSPIWSPVYSGAYAAVRSVLPAIVSRFPQTAIKSFAKMLANGIRSEPVSVSQFYTPVPSSTLQKCLEGAVERMLTPPRLENLRYTSFLWLLTIVDAMVQHCVENGGAQMDVASAKKAIAAESGGEYLIVSVPLVVSLVTKGCTGSHAAVRQKAMECLHVLLQNFSQLPDPDAGVGGVLLLDQFQAEFEAALRSCISTETDPFVRLMSVRIVVDYMCSPLCLEASTRNHVSAMLSVLKMLPQSAAQSPATGGALHPNPLKAVSDVYESHVRTLLTTQYLRGCSWLYNAVLADASTQKQDDDDFVALTHSGIVKAMLSESQVILQFCTLLQLALLDFAVLATQTKKSLRTFKGHLFEGSDFKHVRSDYVSFAPLAFQIYTDLRRNQVPFALEATGAEMADVRPTLAQSQALFGIGVLCLRELLRSAPTSASASSVASGSDLMSVSTLGAEYKAHLSATDLRQVSVLCSFLQLLLADLAHFRIELLQVITDLFSLLVSSHCCDCYFLSCAPLRHLCLTAATLVSFDSAVVRQLLCNCLKGARKSHMPLADSKLFTRVTCDILKAIENTFSGDLHPSASLNECIGQFADWFFALTFDSAISHETEAAAVNCVRIVCGLLAQSQREKWAQRAVIRLKNDSEVDDERRQQCTWFTVAILWQCMHWADASESELLLRRRCVYSVLKREHATAQQSDASCRHCVSRALLHCLSERTSVGTKEVATAMALLPLILLSSDLHSAACVCTLLAALSPSETKDRLFWLLTPYLIQCLVAKNIDSHNAYAYEILSAFVTDQTLDATSAIHKSLPSLPQTALEALRNVASERQRAHGSTKRKGKSVKSKTKGKRKRKKKHKKSTEKLSIDFGKF